MKKVLLISLGTISFIIGTIGIYVPFLPTTGFYFFAAFCFARSSDKLYQKLQVYPPYQEYIVEPFLKRRITPQRKKRLFFSLSIVFALSIFLARPLWVKGMLFGIYLAHIIGLSWYWSKPPRP